MDVLCVILFLHAGGQGIWRGAGKVHFQDVRERCKGSYLGGQRIQDVVRMISREFKGAEFQPITAIQMQGVRGVYIGLA